MDRGGPGQPTGEALGAFTEDVFHWWHRVRDGTLSRTTLRTYIDGQRPWLRDLLERGTECGCAKAEALCRSLLAWEPALWTFVRRDGVEPTNNAAERALRPAVLWRKRSQGSRSETVCWFVERVLTGLWVDVLEAFPDMDRFVRTFETLQAEILNYFEGRQASGPVEGINNKARVIVKRAYGLKSAASLWTRLVLDLNRGRDVVRHTIEQIRGLVAGFRAAFACT